MSISNLIFTACVAGKNQVRNIQEIKFKNQFRETGIFKNQVQIDKGKISLFFLKLRIMMIIHSKIKPALQSRVGMVVRVLLPKVETKLLQC